MRLSVLLGSSAMLIAMSAPASAQSGSPPIATPPSGASDAAASSAAQPPAVTGQAASEPASNTTLGDIVVTAQRRSENLQNVPLAVTAISASDLSRAGVGSITDLKVAVPSLNIISANGYLSANIRGIGSTLTGPGIESQTSLYIDDVYYVFTAPSLLALNSIAQVAVLKGPQGTLFGRNATAGVIQVTTLAPTSTPTGQFQFDYGSYNRLKATAYVAGGLAQNITADIAAVYTRQADGWGRNLTTGKPSYNIPFEYAIRSKIVATPTSGTKLTLIADYNRTKNSLASLSAVPGTLNGSTNPPVLSPDLGYNTVTGGPDLQFGHAFGVSGKIEQDLGSIEIVNITAYRQSEYNLQFDYDGLPAQISNLLIKQTDNQVTEEFRLQSKGNSKFQWVAGAFYMGATSGLNDVVLQRPIAKTDIVTHGYTHTESVAGFGQATLEILPDTHLTGGIRYTHEDRSQEDASQRLVGEANGATLAVFSAPPTREISNSAVTWRASVDHRFSPEVLIYASANTGFKSGGFNVSSPAAAPFQPEKINAYEGGIKTDLLDRRLRVNGAFYYYDYRNIQVNLNNNGAVATLNGPSATVKGVDVDFQAILTNRLRMSGGLNISSPKFGSWILNGVPTCPVLSPQGGVPAGVGNCQNNLLPLASRYSGNVRVDYILPLRSGSIDFSGDAAYRSRFFFSPDNSTPQGRVITLNSSITWTNSNGHLTVGAYIKNLTDQRVAAFESENLTAGYLYARYEAPRTFGGSVGYKF